MEIAKWLLQERLGLKLKPGFVVHYDRRTQTLRMQEEGRADEKERSG